MDLKLQEITLPAFLWYILPGLTFVLVAIALPLVLLDPAQILQLDSLGGAVFVLLAALIAGFVMDSMKIYAIGFHYEKRKDSFFKKLAQELDFPENKIPTLMDVLRVGLPERGPLGKAVAFSHSRWVMMTHSAKCFYLFALIWLMVAVALPLQGGQAWYQTALGLHRWWVAGLADLVLIVLMLAVGYRIERHAAKQRKTCDDLYFEYARLYRSKLRAEWLDSANARGPLDERRVLSWLRTVAKLKEIKRRGWQQHGLEQAETVADHTFMTCILAFVLAPYAGVDRERSVLLALMHDVPESIVGDFTPNEIEPGDKRERESEAASRLADELDDPELFRLWEEADSGDSPEARFVRDLDGLEAALQATIYEDANDALDLREFQVSARQRTRGPVGVQMLQAIAKIGRRSE